MLGSDKIAQLKVLATALKYSGRGLTGANQHRQGGRLVVVTFAVYQGVTQVIRGTLNTGVM